MTEFERHLSLRLPLDLLTALSGFRPTDRSMQLDTYPDTGESGDAYDAELSHARSEPLRQ